MMQPGMPSPRGQNTTLCSEGWKRVRGAARRSLGRTHRRRVDGRRRDGSGEAGGVLPRGGRVIIGAVKFLGRPVAGPCR